MALTGVHLLLTYKCNAECDHCFVWGSPFLEGTMTLEGIRAIYEGAKELGTVDHLYFEGGEPFLYYPIMVKAMEEARALGFECGIVTNGYWVTALDDTVEWLRPISEIGVMDLSISSDLFHGEEEPERQKAKVVEEAARQLGLPAEVIAIEEPCLEEVPGEKGEPIVGGSVVFRGRAVVKLVKGLPRRPWQELKECPYETLDDPKRVHIDYLGHVHLCQGLTIGNALERSLAQVMSDYDPTSHPIVGPLLSGGPAALVERYSLPHEEGYVEACHLCYVAREMLRPQFPEALGPGQMYGEGLE
ncbi:MAG: radical SAM protein [Anaerolineae bacterium]|nr:radical SAM protein [Anaerolineae bacterium]